MDDKQLREIRDRADKATPGDWHCESDNEGGWFVVVENKSDPDGYFSICMDSTVPQKLDAIVGKNFSFIAHARTDVPALLDEVERLKAENAWLHCMKGYKED